MSLHTSHLFPFIPPPCCPVLLASPWLQQALTNLAESEAAHEIFINIDGVATLVARLDAMVHNKEFVQESIATLICLSTNPTLSEQVPASSCVLSVPCICVIAQKAAESCTTLCAQVALGSLPSSFFEPEWWALCVCIVITTLRPFLAPADCPAGHAIDHQGDRALRP